MYMARRQQAWQNSIKDYPEGELLLRVLAELSRRYYHLMRNLASVAETARSRIDAKRQEGAIDSVDDEWITKEIIRQCQLTETMNAIQKQVLIEEGCTEA